MKNRGLGTLEAHKTYKYLMEKWWLETELNRRHKDFQSSALPTELSSHPVGGGTLNGFASLLARMNSGTWMGGVISTLQPLGGHMGVNLGRDQMSVAQQLLYASQVRTRIQQMSSETVP